ncbi:hypothetical protein [Butyrivibrio sp. AE3006]|nr:hypothetical protein [Butyrivibrio sp. AE3006]
MKIALTSASAGTGNFLDDENFDEIEIFDHVPRNLLVQEVFHKRQINQKL